MAPYSLLIFGIVWMNGHGLGEGIASSNKPKINFFRKDSEEANKHTNIQTSKESNADGMQKHATGEDRDHQLKTHTQKIDEERSPATSHQPLIIEAGGSQKDFSRKAAAPSYQPPANQAAVILQESGWFIDSEGDNSNLEPTFADSQICQEIYFHKTCQPHPEKLVLLVSVNDGMVDFFEQWHNAASKFLDKRCMHLRVMAEDDDAKRDLARLSEQNHWDLDIREDLDVQVSNKSMIRLQNVPEFDWNSKEYNTLVDRRPLYINDLLQQGCTTFYADIDTIWKKSPFIEIAAKEKGQAGFYAISDERSKDDPVHNFCTCLLYINPTASSLNIVGKWIQRLHGQIMVDQDAFSDVLSSGNLSQDVTLLPYERFPPGCSYSTYKREAAIAHANYLVGHEAKAAFLKAVAEEMSVSE